MNIYRNKKINVKSNSANEKNIPLGSEADTTEDERSNPNTKHRRKAVKFI